MRCGMCGQQVDDTAGLPQLNAAHEVLFLLPDGFVRAYSELFHTAFQDQPPSFTARDPDSQRVSKRKKPGKMQAQGQTTLKTGRWVVRSERAMDRKRYVDRQLRKIARWISSRNAGEPELVDKCECGIWLERGWHYCPRCGTKVQIPA